MCGAEDDTGRGAGTLDHIIDIYDDRIVLADVNNKNGKTYTSCVDTSKNFNTQLTVLRAWASYLYKVENSNNVWGNISLRSALGYTQGRADSIRGAIKAITGKTVFIEKGGSAGSYAQNTDIIDDLHTRIYIVKGNAYQARIYFKSEIQDDVNPDVLVTFLKRDFDSKKVEGAEIDIRAKSNVSKIIGLTDHKLISGSNGSFGTIRVQPTENTGTFKLTVKETKFPVLHDGYTGEITVTVTYNTENGAVTKIESNKSNYVPTRNDKYVILRNTPTPIEIKKYDFNSNELNDATFNIYFNNIDSIKINGEKLDLRDIATERKDKKTGYYKVITDKTWGEYKYSCTNETDWNSVIIKGIKPNDTITDIVPANYTTIKTIYVTISEATAPSGYAKIPQSLYLTLNRQDNGKWTLNPREDDYKSTAKGENLPDEYYDLDGNTIKFYDPYKIEELELLKTDTANASVNGAKFSVKVENVSKIGDTAYNNGTAELTNVEVKNGKFSLKGLVFKDQTKPIIVTINETYAPPGYKKIEGWMKVTITRDGNTYKVVKTKANTVLDSEFKAETINNITNHKVSIGIKNIPVISKIALVKIDGQSESKVEGATFKIKLTNVLSVKGYTSVTDSGILQINNISTDKNGNIVLEDLVIKDINQKVKIELEETSAAQGYKKINGKITVELKRSGASYTVTATKAETVLDDEFMPEYVSEENGEVTLNIINIPLMNLGGMVWEDGQTGSKKVEEADGKFNKHYVYERVGEGKGDYKYEQNEYTHVGDGNGDYIRKEIQEEGMANIEVKLYNEAGEHVTKDFYGNNLMTKTAEAGTKVTYKNLNGSNETITLEKGQYVFPNLRKGTYYVQFSYDGVNYKTVELSRNPYQNNDESKVTEINRDTFNAKFTTISSSNTTDTAQKSYSKANGLDSDMEYVYNTEKAVQSGEKVVKSSTLVTKDNNGTVKQQYKMNAKSVNYLNQAADWKNTWTSDGKINTNHYGLDINCGLEYRFFDLSVGTDIENAKLTINGKSTTYTYAQILDGKFDKDITLEELLDKHVSTEVDEENENYNLYLEYSDYNYRIDDYVMPSDESTFTNQELSDAEINELVDEYGALDINNQLRAFVTYKIVIQNQSTINSAKVSELAYYYDKNYQIVSAETADGRAITIKDDSSIPVIGDKKAARISGFAEALSADDYRQELYITFEIKRNAQGELPASIENNDNGIVCANIVEILKYETTEGLVDNDSCPGNASINNKPSFEDDTDEAQGLNIRVKTTTREITGTVWDDGDTINKETGGAGLGKKEAGEAGINDVIVQLIEVKESANTGNYLEYIWQEVRTGNSAIRKRNLENGRLETSSGTALARGQYKFTGFIPGDYIIRFIYGDGRTYSVTPTPNVKEYNGQDYQSTLDSNYSDEWYNNAGYAANESVARDNEARRLKVMSYSVAIDNEKWNKLETLDNDAMKNTWMCAETSRINVPVDGDTTTTEETTTVSFTLRENSIKFNDMNFGLVKRPETKLEIEKHITGLKVTPTGTNVQPIVDGKTEIEDVLNNRAKVSGIRVLVSNRNDPGSWTVETDLEELIQGAKLEVEYTYVIRNASEKNYLDKDLIREYVKSIDNIEEYKNYLTTISGRAKSSMRKGEYANIGNFIGKYYYTGDFDENIDAEVLSRVENIEEALNNKLIFNKDIAGVYFEEKAETVGDATKREQYYTTDGKLADKDIQTVIKTTEPSNILEITGKNIDTKYTIKLQSTLSSVSNGTVGIEIPSYIAEIISYSNAAGRRDMESEPDNLSYVHSEDRRLTLNSYVTKDANGDIIDVKPEKTSGYTKINEVDEFWGETIVLSKPTGEDKNLPLQIAIITIASMAAVTVGIVLIKKYALKK